MEPPPPSPAPGLSAPDQGREEGWKVGPAHCLPGRSGLLCAEVGHGRGRGAGWGLPGSSWRGRDRGEGSRAFPLLSPWTQACHPPETGTPGTSPTGGSPLQLMDQGAACSGLLPSLFLLCHMNFVTSSLFISVSSFVKWKEGCWSELEVGAGTAVCCHHASGVGPPARRWGWLAGLVCRAHSTRRCASPTSVG